MICPFRLQLHLIADIKASVCFPSFRVCFPSFRFDPSPGNPYDFDFSSPVHSSSVLYSVKTTACIIKYNNCRLVRGPRINQEAYKTWAPQSQRNNKNRLRGVESILTVNKSEFLSHMPVGSCVMRCAERSCWQLVLFNKILNKILQSNCREKK